MAMNVCTGQDPVDLVDEFNRGDSATLGGSWTEGTFGFGTDLAISSNTVASGGGDEQTAHHTDSSGSQIAVCYEISTVDTTDYAFMVCARNTSADTGYFCHWVPSTDALEVWHATEGGSYTLDSSISLSADFVQGDLFGVLFDDTGSQVDISVHRKNGANAWTELGSGTAVTRKAGPYYGGIGLYQTTTARIDDFRAEVARPKADLFSDNFDDDSFDTTKWSNIGSISETSSQMELTAGSVGFQASIFTKTSPAGHRDIRDSYAVVKLVTPPTVDTDYIETGLYLHSEGNVLWLTWWDGDITAQIDHSGSGGSWSLLGSEPFDADDHGWLRIRESGGTLYFEVAPPHGLDWTELVSTSTPTWADSLRLELLYANDNSSDQTVVLDEFNVPLYGAAPPLASATASCPSPSIATGEIIQPPLASATAFVNAPVLVRVPLITAVPAMATASVNAPSLANPLSKVILIELESGSITLKLGDPEAVVEL